MAETVYSKLLQIQSELKAPKSKYNKFGKFNYRSCEDILEAVKPLCKKYGMLLLISEEIISFEGSYDEQIDEIDEETKRTTGKAHISGEGYRYIKATATIINIEDEKSVSSSAAVREAVRKKGMDTAQISGTTSSYAKKRSLSNLFAIDDSDDVDGEEPQDSAGASQRLTTPRKADKQNDTAPAQKNAPRAPQNATDGNTDTEDERIAQIKAKIKAAAARTGKANKEIFALVTAKGYDVHAEKDFKAILKFVDSIQPEGDDPF